MACTETKIVMKIRNIALAAACAAAAASAAAAQDQNVNHHSTRSNRSPSDGIAAPPPGAPVSVGLAGLVKLMKRSGLTSTGDMSFSDIEPGDYTLTITPTTTPAAQITGVELSQNALVSCGAPANNTLVCTPLTVLGTGPQTVTVKLLGKPTRATPNTGRRDPSQTAPAKPKSPQG
jgi:hypothetical protein